MPAPAPSPAPGSNYAPTSHATAEVARGNPGGSGGSARTAGGPSASPATRHHTGSTRALSFGVLTTSHTHTEEDEASGAQVKGMLAEAGQRVSHYALVANSVADIRDAVAGWLADPTIEVILTLGGTGVSSRDVTVEALAGMGGRVLEGFGDLYRMLSFQEVGPLAVLSRASLFAIQNRPVFAIPGSERACRLAGGRLGIPAAEHLVDELAR